MRALRSRCAIAVVAALSLVAAACGGDDDDSDASVQPSATEGASSTTAGTAGGSSTTVGPTTTTTAPEPTDIDPTGVLKYGDNLLPGTGVHFDPNQLRTQSGMQWMSLVYGTLVQGTEDGGFEPWMAKDVETVDPSTVRITLRPGVTFTDGAAYDAAAVQKSLMRQRFEVPNPTIETGLHTGLKALQTVDVVDPLTVLVHLNQPIAAVFIEALTGRPGLVQSPKQIAENPDAIDLTPVGAGPYTMQAFLAGQRIELRKNPNFWDADNWKIGAIDFVHTPPGAPQATGLLSEAIDFNLPVPVADVDALKANGDLTVEVMPGRFTTMLPCTGKPPFDNEKFRQAIQIGIDREEYNELVYAGQGEPAWGVYREGHPAYDPALKAQMAYNPDRAKQLLAESGLTNPSFEIAIVASNNFGRQAEVMQAQLQRLGITTTIKSYNNIYDEWIQPQAPGALMAFQPNQPIGGYLHFATWSLKGNIAAYCGNEDPEVMAKVSAAVQLAPDDPKSISLFKEANRLYVEHARAFAIVFDSFPVVWNSSKVGGTPVFSTEYGQPRLHFDSIYVKK